MKIRITKRSTIILCLLGSCILLMIQVGAIQAQGEGEGDDLGDVETNYPEEVAEFHRKFIEHYMEQQERISDLRTIRSAGDRQRAQDLVNTIREQTNDARSELREVYRAAREKETSPTFLKRMRNMLKVYSLYVDKVVTNWEPTDQQVLKRRRMSDNEIVQEQPELAGSSLLRRVFLGELLSSALTVPRMGNWFQKRVSNVRSWIRQKYNDLFPLFVRLVSRVDRVFGNEESTEDERQQVVQEVRKEWNQFWRAGGEKTEWQKRRRTVNRLRSLFRDRSNRLPGAQERLNERVRRLQKNIGDLRRLQTRKPFSSRANRLAAMLELSKAFVERANELGNSNQSKAISTIPAQFIRNHIESPPEQIWGKQGVEALREQKSSKVEEINNDLVGLQMANYKQEREKYNFPIDAILNLVRRLGTNYGQQEQAIARSVREMTRYVQGLYTLSTQGVELMQAYQRTLNNFSIEQPEQVVKFEQGFREKHKGTLQKLKGVINTKRETEDRIDEIVSRVREIDPAELASAYAARDEKNGTPPSSSSD